MKFAIVYTIIFTLFACLVAGQTTSIAEEFPVDEASLNEQWEAFKKENNKQYTSREENERRKLFEENIKNVINKHNRLVNQCASELCLGGEEQNEINYQTGLNSFVDMSSEEFKDFFLGLSLPEDVQKYKNCSLLTRIKSKQRRDSLFSIPASFDWRDQGVSKQILNQKLEDKSCSSCWAFSAASALEGQLKIKKNKTVELSPQELLDCAYENNQCMPGWIGRAFNYVKDNGGLSETNNYPYRAKAGICKNDIPNVKIKVVDQIMINNGEVDENALVEAIFRHGPISVAIDSSPDTFKFYKTGIYFDPKCKAVEKKEFNHAVTLVGYGTADGKDYFIVKNSWGVKWGEKGFMRMARNRNACGIGRYSLYPLIE